MSSSNLTALAVTESTRLEDNKADQIELPAKQVAETYILGPGDTVSIQVDYLPDLGGRYSIGPDGSLYLPVIKEVPAEGLTLDELREVLLEKYKTFVKSPEVTVRSIVYRPIRVYVGGEVQRPGYYTLSGTLDTSDSTGSSDVVGTLRDQAGAQLNAEFRNTRISGPNRINLFPTIFDAIRAAQGITTYANLSNVEVTRKRPKTQGGTKLKTNLNFLALLTKGDDSQNIRVFDSDVITVSKSNNVLREQVLRARNTNLSPRNLEVYVSGRVRQPGPVTIKQGSGLTQAIAYAGGPQLFIGKVEFLRFQPNGDIDRRVFSFSPKAKINSYKNPVLVAGDVIRVRESLLSATSAVITEVSRPAVGAFSLYTLFGGR